MGITLTEKAIKKVKDIQEEQKITNTALRLGLKGGGCAGFRYEAFFDSEPATEKDTVFTFGDQVVLVDEMSLQYLDGVTVDYVDNGLMGSGFQFLNPSAKSTCGCGASFSA